MRRSKLYYEKSYNREGPYYCFFLTFRPPGSLLGPLTPVKRKCFNLDEKIEILYCEHFFVGRTSIPNILKQVKPLRTNFEFFKGHYKKRSHGKCHILNEILYNWYGKSRSSNTYPDGALLQEKTMEIKKDWIKKS